LIGRCHEREALLSCLAAKGLTWVILVLLVAVVSGSVVLAVRSGWHRSSALLALALGLALIAGTGGAAHYLVTSFLASRCAWFVTLKYVAIVPARPLLWPAWGCWCISAYWAARGPSGAAGTLRRRLGALAAYAIVAVALVFAPGIDERAWAKVVALRHDYYHGAPRFDACARHPGE
jgi:hypothetical protein